MWRKILGKMLVIIPLCGGLKSLTYRPTSSLKMFQSTVIPSLVIIPLCGLLTGCGAPQLTPPPENPKPVLLKVVNYNLWHGLGQGYFVREELESDVRRNKRYAEQIRLLKQEKPDVLFLQELNPVSSRSKAIAKDLGMSYIFERTNCGTSILGLGIPINLNMGIAILVRPPLQIQKIAGVKLSGPIGFCSALLTFQYGEFRFALFGLAYHPDYGSFILANTHLHHGPEWSNSLREKIKSWESEGVLTSDQRKELEDSVEKSNMRRKNEVTNLFSSLNEFRNTYKNLPLILAGDFNSTVDSPVYKTVIETHKLTDSMGNYSPTPYTWNPKENQENHRYTANFGVSVPVFDKKDVETFFKVYDQRVRRIDYVFVNNKINILSHALFANEPNAEGIIGSDHFGVLVQLKTN